MATHTYITNEVKPEQRSKAFWIVSDAIVLIGRSLKHIFKNSEQLIGLTAQPIMFMVLFRYVFGGAINTGGTSYVNFLIAGVLVQSLAFGSLTTSISVATDLQRGIVDRIKSLPIASWTLLMGHVAADLVRNIIQSIILVSAGLLVGFRPEASFGDWLLITCIILLFTFAMSWAAAVMGLVGKTVEVVQTYGFFFIFPLTFASAAFAPTDSMPIVLRAFAENQPVTHVIEAIRALMIGTPIGSHAFIAITWCVGVLVVSIPLAGYLFRRHSGR